jgi:hypothetical protein
VFAEIPKASSSTKYALKERNSTAMVPQYCGIDPLIRSYAGIPSPERAKHSNPSRFSLIKFDLDHWFGAHKTAINDP